MLEIPAEPGSAPRDGLPDGPLRLSTLVRLRWLAIAGQAVAVVLVRFWFAFPLPLVALLALICLSAFVNVFLSRRYAGSRQLDPTSATVILGYDILQLTGLLYLTGGLGNPFAILLLAPVMVAATALKPDKTFLLGGLALICTTLLAFAHLPLPWTPESPIEAPLLYTGGVWVALASTLVFMAIYTQRVSRDARQLAEALAATELALQREQHLSALDGLAAAAAHELGTPLATIALVASELDADLGNDPGHGEDIRLLRSQSQRCRDILAKLTSLSAVSDLHLGPQSLTQGLEDVVALHRDFGVRLVVNAFGKGPEPVFRRNPGMLHGLGNIVENAVDFAVRQVDVDAGWDDTTVWVRISDDGPGFPPEILSRIGEPYLTTRRDNGLGLGFFIAKSLLERTGAQTEFANRQPSPAARSRAGRAGAVVTVTWPRDRFEADKETNWRTEH